MTKNNKIENLEKDSEEILKDRYFYHPESDSYWILKANEDIPNDMDANLSIEITKEEYEKRIACLETPEDPLEETPEDPLEETPEDPSENLEENTNSKQEKVIKSKQNVEFTKEEKEIYKRVKRGDFGSGDNLKEILKQFPKVYDIIIK